MSGLAVGAALFAAFTWGLASLLMDRSFSSVAASGEEGEQIPAPTPAAGNLYRNLFNLLGFGALALAAGDPLPATPVVGWLLLSGVLGFALGDVCFFASFRWCGVQTASSVGLVTVPMSVVMAWAWLGEELNRQTLLSMAVVLGGVLVVVSDNSQHRRRYERPWVGVGLVVFSAFIWASAVVLGHGALDGVGIAVGGGLRVVGGVLGAFFIAMAMGVVGRSTSVRAQVHQLTAPLHTRSVARLLLLPALCASLLNQLPYNYALRELPGGICALLFATTPLFTLPLGRLLGHSFGMRTVVGTVVGMVGVAGVVLSPDDPPQDPALPVHLDVLEIEGPQEPGRWPRLVADHHDQVHMIWTRQNIAGSALRRARFVQGQWSEPETLANGGDWFVNWADFPALAIGSNGHLAAWLEKLGKGTFAYGVRLGWRGSPESGSAWLHTDTQGVEHGFVSLTPVDAENVFAVWLDARGTLDEDGELDSTGAMALYGRSVSFAGELGEEFCLDERVCECCQTDALALADGRAVVVWRDRSDHEIRDIAWSVGRPSDPASFTAPRRLHPDEWHIPACPVNGPALCATPTQVGLAWFSAGGGQSRVQLALAPYADQKPLEFEHFVRVDAGQALGRVDTCALPDGSVLVTWLEGPLEQARWCARRVAIFGGKPTLGRITELAQVRGDRGDGFLRLLARPQGALGAYQNADTGAPALVRVQLVQGAAPQGAGG